MTLVVCPSIARHSSHHLLSIRPRTMKLLCRIDCLCFPPADLTTYPTAVVEMKQWQRRRRRANMRRPKGGSYRSDIAAHRLVRAAECKQRVQRAPCVRGEGRLVECYWKRCPGYVAAEVDHAHAAHGKTTLPAMAVKDDLKPLVSWISLYARPHITHHTLRSLDELEKPPITVQ